MTKRRLHPDELELWERVAQNAKRLHARKVIVEPSKKPTMTKPGNTRSAIERFALGQHAAPKAEKIQTPQSLAESLRRAELHMDAKAHARLKRGKLRPEARIDLHGMTLDRAHPALTSFILRAYQQQKRLVLVITGKGKERDDGGPIPVRLGVLRHQVPQWLTLAPLAQVVLQIVPAHISHGGGGAYYVYLRRNG